MYPVWIVGITVQGENIYYIIRAISGAESDEMKYTRFNSNAGFTLIELLVVIAIIGVLAGVVLASLNSARLKGRDAAILSEIAQFRVLYEMELSLNNSYAQLKGGWRANAASCTFEGQYADSAQRICQKLVELAGNNCQNPSGCVYIGATNPDSNFTYTVISVLPGATANADEPQWACAGSSGATYTGPGIGWEGAGCYNNP